MRTNLVIFAGLMLFFWSCATETPPLAMVQPVKPPQGDDYKLVPAADFLTEYPDWVPAEGLKSWTSGPSELRLTFSSGETITLTFLTPEDFRILAAPDGPYPSYAVVKTSWPEVPLTVTEQPEALSFKTARLEGTLGKNTGTLTLYRQGARLAEFPRLLSRARGSNRIKTDLSLAGQDKEFLFGLGEKAGPLTQGGRQLKMWNSDTYRYTTETDPIYLSIPFFVNANPQNTFGVFFDNTYQTYFDTGKTDPGTLTFGALGGNLDVYFFGSGSLKSILKTYSELTGRIPLPPRWALGYQQSRYSYATAEEVLSVASTFREKKLPADVIYLDIDFMSQYRSFTHQKQNFPDPKALMDQLEALYFKVVTILDPGIARAPGYSVYETGLERDVFVKNGAGALRTGTVWPGNCVFPDYTKPETRAWWGEQYKVLLDWGIDGFWNDMNEPSVFNTKHKTLPWDSVHYDFGLQSLHAKVHNVYGLEMLRATSEGLEALRPGQRNFVLGRAGYAGVQRYAATWTGDNTADWSHLKMNLTMALNLGLSGQPWSGADVGGYSDTPSPELMSRWMHLGALMPFYRNHTEKGTAPQEPWAFGPETEKTAKAALELRYTLLPLLYDLFYEASRTGSPLLRPLFLEFPQDPKTYRVDDQFLLGKDLLAAPVVTPGQLSRSVYLPAGTSWFDWWTGQEYRGGATYDIPAPLDKIPLFVRAGGIIPTQEPEEWLGQKKINPITLQIYPGAQGDHLVWQDDGLTLGYKEGVGRGTRFTFDMVSPREMAVTQSVETRHPQFRPELGYYLIRIHQARRPAKVLVGREEIPLYGDSFGVTDSDRNTAWYERDNTLLIKVINWNLDQSIRVLY